METFQRCFPQNPGKFCTLINNPLTPNPVNDLVYGSPQHSLGSVIGLTEETENTVSVICNVVGAFENDGTQKTVPGMDTDPCEVPGEGCWTRTPGYWATHMDEAQAVLDSGVDGYGEINCGIDITETDDSVYGSTVQDMCSIGKDPKSFNDGKTIPSQLAQLTRQCMAAQLNLAITGLFEGDCNSADVGDDHDVNSGVVAAIANCCGIGTVPGENSICNPPSVAAYDPSAVTACIGLVDWFNNSDDDDFEDENDICELFDVDCNAEPMYCQDAKNDGYMNHGRENRESSVATSSSSNTGSNKGGGKKN